MDELVTADWYCPVCERVVFARQSLHWAKCGCGTDCVPKRLHSAAETDLRTALTTMASAIGLGECFRELLADYMAAQSVIAAVRSTVVARGIAPGYPHRAINRLCEALEQYDAQAAARAGKSKP